ncbi:MAG: hypothetical protein C4329_13020 [Chitinophagaceae bacterium]
MKNYLFFTGAIILLALSIWNLVVHLQTKPHDFKTFMAVVILLYALITVIRYFLKIKSQFRKSA